MSLRFPGGRSGNPPGLKGVPQGVLAGRGGSPGSPWASLGVAGGAWGGPWGCPQEAPGVHRAAPKTHKGSQGVFAALAGPLGWSSGLVLRTDLGEGHVYIFLVLKGVLRSACFYYMINSFVHLLMCSCL